MADFVQRDGEYPRLPDAPELIYKSSPYPFMLYTQESPDIMIATGEYKTELDELSRGGTVDLSTRPIITGTSLIAKGWDVPPDEIATVFSSTFTNQDFGVSSSDVIAINVTPILADGTVLSADELADEAYDILINNKDTYKIQMGSKFKGTDMDTVIDEAVEVAIHIHELHQEVVAEATTYPHIAGLPEVVPFEPPTPYILYAQADGKLDGYPRLIGVPEFLPFASPLPWLVFGQDGVTLDGYPYIETPKIYPLFDKPIPFLFIKPVKTKYKNIRITLFDYSSKIVIQKERV